MQMQRLSFADRVAAIPEDENLDSSDVSDGECENDSDSESDDGECDSEQLNGTKT